MSDAHTTVRIGTRGSPLALAQAHEVRDRLAAAHPGLTTEIVVIKTTGDKILDRTLGEIGGKGLFTKEIEEALLAGAIDLAVHSMKDMPTTLPDGLALSCILEREDVRDAWISPAAANLADLPAGAVVGTASLRRQAQILHRRPDLTVIPFRGNVQTRLRKLAEGAADATLLALAGLKRLGLRHEATALFEPDEMLPAVAQGAIGLETRRDDARLGALLAPLHHPASARCIAAERALLAALDGSCRTPIAALARLNKAGGLSLIARIYRPDGSQMLEAMRRGPAGEGEAMGRDAGDELRGRAGPGFFTS